MKMEIKQYTDTEIRKIVQNKGHDIGDENNIIDPELVSIAAKKEGYGYHEPSDTWIKGLRHIDEVKQQLIHHYAVSNDLDKQDYENLATEYNFEQYDADYWI